MKTLKCWWAVLLITVVVAGFANKAYANDAPVFTHIDAPSGVAATPGKVLVTEYCGDHRHILRVSDTGIVSIFATLPSTGGGCSESYIAISPGMGGFEPNAVFVTYGRDILKISPDGLAVSVFATISSLNSANNGITFDEVGTFGHDMIVTDFNGGVWRVNAHGEVTALTNALTRIEGPRVAPMSFAPFGGQLLVAAENANSVFAISPTGAITTVGAWTFAESVNFVPKHACEFGDSDGAYFVTVFPDLQGRQGLIRFPASDFAGLGGSALVPSETNGGIGLFTSRNGSIFTSTFKTNIGQHEGNAFVDCNVPLEVKIKIRRHHGEEEDDDSAESEGNFRVTIFSTPKFNAPSQVVPASLTFGRTGNEHSFEHCKARRHDDDHADQYGSSAEDGASPRHGTSEEHGLKDLVCDFSAHRAAFHRGDSRGYLKGKTVDGLTIMGNDSLHSQRHEEE